MGLPTRKLTGLLAGIVLLVAATGCGIDANSAPEDVGVSGSAANYQEPANGKSRNVVPARATPRTQGRIRIVGQAQGSLTKRLVTKYEADGGIATVDSRGGSERSGFAEFCRGQADIVDSARPISPQEYRRCVARGIQPVQFQVASDAAVLAIKNETDVGVDCLSFDEVRSIFQAGSPINSWSQVGYDHDMTVDASAPRVQVAGPDEDSNVFGFFGQYVLGDDEPTLLSVRGDYESYPTDAGVRRAVIGTNRDFLASEQYEPSKKVLENIVSSIADAKQTVKDAKAEKAKGIRDKRSKAAKARDQRILDKARATLRGLESDLKDSRRYVKANREARGRIASTRGTLGLFRFSYYEAFEEQLRPMEISSSNDFRKPECIFPSQTTVTDATYPLARQLLLTVNYKNINDSDINDFLTSALANSQKQAEAAALVPLPDKVRDTEQGWLNGTSEPDIIFYNTSTGNKKPNKTSAVGE